MRPELPFLFSAENHCDLMSVEYFINSMPRESVILQAC